MEVTFLVSVNIDEIGSLQALADQMADDLTASGFEVLSAKPWARPVNQPAGGLTSLPSLPTL